MKNLLKNPIVKIILGVSIVVIILIIFFVTQTKKNNTPKYLLKEDSKFGFENVEVSTEDAQTTEEEVNPEFQKYIQEKQELHDKIETEKFNKSNLDTITYNASLTINNNLEYHITELVCYSENAVNHLNNVAVTEDYFNQLKEDKKSCLTLNKDLFYVTNCGIADDDRFFAVIMDSQSEAHVIKGQITNDKISSMTLEK